MSYVPTYGKPLRAIVTHNVSPKGEDPTPVEWFSNDPIVKEEWEYRYPDGSVHKEVYYPNAPIHTKGAK